jgi:GntR family transcriptional regulator
MIALILDGVIKDGEPLPSVRSVAADLRVNPLTVLKAYQDLADAGLVEKRRGLGMFVAPGAAAALRIDERTRFLTQEWPRVRATILRLGLTPDELFDSAASAEESKEN